MSGPTRPMSADLTEGYSGGCGGPGLPMTSTLALSAIACKHRRRGTVEVSGRKYPHCGCLSVAVWPKEGAR